MKKAIALGFLLSCTALLAGCHRVERAGYQRERAAVSGADNKMANEARELLRNNAKIEDVKKRLGSPSSQWRLPHPTAGGPRNLPDHCSSILFYDYRPGAFLGMEFDEAGRIIGAIGPFPPLAFLSAKLAHDSSPSPEKELDRLMLSDSTSIKGRTDFEAAVDWFAWFLAYELPNDTDSAAERWTCILHAITYTQMGLRYNPHSSKLAERMARIFFEKIGGDLDTHADYFRKRMAWLMQDFMEHRGNQNVQEWRSHPECAAARGLREGWMMDRTDVMVGMEKQYGRFDWRLPAAHAIYWIRLAAENAPRRSEAQQFSDDHIMRVCLEESMRRGQIAYLGADANEPLVTAHDFSKMAHIDALLREQLRRTPENKGLVQMGPPRGHEHVAFLEEAECVLLFAGYKAEAAKYHRFLHELYNKPDPYLDVEASTSVRVRRFAEEYATHANFRVELVDPLIIKTCLNVCVKSLDEARLNENFAKCAWEYYLSSTEENAQGRPHAAGSAPPTFDSLEREDVLKILSGKSPFPTSLMKALRAALKVADDADLEKGMISLPLVAPIPPDSPLPN